MSQPDTKVKLDITKTSETQSLLKSPRVRLMSGKEREDIMDTQQAIINQFKIMAGDIEHIFATDSENTLALFDFIQKQEEYIKSQTQILEAEKKEKAATKIENQKRDRVGYALGSMSTTTAVAATAALNLPVDAILNSGSGAMTIGIGLGRAYEEILELCKYIGSCLPSSWVEKCTSTEKTPSASEANNPINKSQDKKNNADRLSSDAPVSPSAAGIDIKVRSEIVAQPKTTILKQLSRNPKSKEVYIGNTVDLIQKQFESNQDIIALIEGKKDQLKAITDFISQQMDIMKKQKFALEVEAQTRKFEAADKVERERIGYMCGTGLSVAAIIGTAAASVPIAGVISAAGGAMTCGIGLGRGSHRAITKCFVCLGNHTCRCDSTVNRTPPPSPQMDRQERNATAIPTASKVPVIAAAAKIQNLKATGETSPNAKNPQSPQLSDALVARPSTPQSNAGAIISMPSIIISPLNISPSTAPLLTNVVSPTSSASSGSPVSVNPSLKPVVLVSKSPAGSLELPLPPVSSLTTLPIIKRPSSQSAANKYTASTNARSIPAGGASGARGRSTTGSTASLTLGSGTPKVAATSRLRSATPTGKSKPSSNKLS